jgi:hypothetical protein
MSDTEIFEKPAAPAPEIVKKTRKLTEKQLENLAKGRAKMAEKRAAMGTKPVEHKPVEPKPEQQPPKSMDKELAKIEKDGIKEQKQQRKTAKKIEKQQLKSIDKADDVISKNKMANFKEISVSFMEKCETPEQLKLLKKMLARYTKDILWMDDTKLKQKMTRDLSVIRDYVMKNK